MFYYREKYEPLLQFGHELVPVGGVVIDCGANQGTYTCAFATAVGPTGRVIAVEPIPQQTARIRGNVALNAAQNCEVVQAAISDTDGTATLYLRNKDVEASLVRSKAGEALEVETLTLDTLSAELPRLDLIKLDVEGAEAMAIDGGSATLASFKPILVCESNDDSRFAVGERLSAVGYRAFVRETDGYRECDTATFAETLFYIHNDNIDRVFSSLPDRVAVHRNIVNEAVA